MASKYGLYKPGQTKPFNLSRSKIDLFVNCPCCFWLDRILGIGRPRGPSFLINQAIDTILKREFDESRQKQTIPPLLEPFKIKAIPYQSPEIDTWREPFKGIRFHHQKTNFMVFGGLDDVWQDKESKKLIVVDYKATAKKGAVDALGPVGTYHDAYRRQIEVYQWLLKNNDHQVLETGYFVYANGDVDQKKLVGAAKKVGQLNFKIEVFSHQAKSLDWIEKTLIEIKDCLEKKQPPKRSPGCEFCDYAKGRVQLYKDYFFKK